MTDAEIAVICQVVKQVLAERDTTARAEVASLRQDLDIERVKNAEYRLLQSKSQQQMMKAMGDALINAVVPRFRRLEQRSAELEQRAMPTESKASAAHLLQRAIDGAVPLTGPAL